MIIHKPVSLADQVFERLESDILTGKYQRGEILTEMKLCEELGVSRTPVREALRRLEQEHIIEECGKGMLVLSITAEDAENIYNIRRRIEGLAAAACARCVTDEQLQELQEIVALQEFYAKKRDAEKIKAMDSEFHQKVYKYSGSTVFYDTLVPLHKKIQKFRKTSIMDKSRAKTSTEEHRRVLEAIAAHDPAAAEKAMVDHVCKAQRHLEEMEAIHQTEADKNGND